MSNIELLQVKIEQYLDIVGIDKNLYPICYSMLQSEPEKIRLIKTILYHIQKEYIDDIESIIAIIENSFNNIE